MRRRLLAGAAAAGLGLLLVAPPGADAAPADWNGTRLTNATSFDTAAFNVTAHIHRKYNQSVSEQIVVKAFLTTPAGLASGCPGGGEVEISVTVGEDDIGDPDGFQATAPVTTSCNGTYGVRVQPTLDRRFGSDEPGPTLTGQVTIAAPPPQVAVNDPQYSDGSVVISWDPGTQPADFEAFQVQRRDGDEWTTLGERSPSDSQFVDSTPPAAGGDVRYRVRGRRSAPGGSVYSTGGQKTVNIPASTTTTTPGGGTAGTDGGTTNPGGATGGTAGTDGGATAGTDGGTATGGTGGTGGKGLGRSFAPLPRGNTGVGTKAPRIGSVPQSNYGDLLAGDEDGGYGEELPYGEDGLASEDDSDYSYFSYENTAGRGMAVPVATGFVLAAWAFHLRFLARAAKPVPAAPKQGRGKSAAPRHRPSY